MTQPPEGSVLDRRTLNRTLLARQQLLDRASMPVPDLIEHLVGLQAQVPRDSYIALWSRLHDFESVALERLLLERGAVRMTLMRRTLHLVTARDAPHLRAAMQAVCERGFRSSPFRRQIEGIDLDAVLAAAITIVEERPRTLSELGSALAERWPTHDRTAMAYAVRYLVPLVQATPRGLMGRSSAPRVTTLRAWLGAAEPIAIDSDSRPDEVVLRYLRAFGPATLGDVRAWSGLSDIRTIVERLRPRLRSYRDAAGRELIDVEEGRFAAPDVPAPVRFIGEYDNLILAHADRSRITGDLAWGESYVRQGAFFVDGFLAGAWWLAVSRGDARLTIEARRPLRRSEREAVVSEAEALGAFLAPQAQRRGLVWAPD